MMAVVEANRSAPVVDAESYRLAHCLPDGSAQRGEHLGAAHRQNAVRDAVSHAGF